jgi:hypothetical protein
MVMFSDALQKLITKQLCLITRLWVKVKKKERKKEKRRPLAYF